MRAILCVLAIHHHKPVVGSLQEQMDKTQTKATWLQRQDFCCWLQHGLCSFIFPEKIDLWTLNIWSRPSRPTLLRCGAVFYLERKPKVMRSINCLVLTQKLEFRIIVYNDKLNFYRLVV